MEEILDQSVDQPNTSNIRYGGFWQRFAAVIIDGIILAPFTAGLTYLNITMWKSIPALIIISLIGIAYKPVMEIMYGATLGKMALKLKVTNLSYGTAEVNEILLRNIFHLGSSILTLIITVMIYNDPSFESISGWMEFSTFSQSYTILQIVNGASGLITIIDAIMLGVDDQKRSLHDRIAGTYVIESQG